MCVSGAQSMSTSCLSGSAEVRRRERIIIKGLGRSRIDEHKI